MRTRQSRYKYVKRIWALAIAETDGVGCFLRRDISSGSLQPMLEVSSHPCCLGKLRSFRRRLRVANERLVLNNKTPLSQSSFNFSNSSVTSISVIEWIELIITSNRTLEDNRLGAARSLLANYGGKYVYSKSWLSFRKRLV